MNKRILSLILALTMIFGMIPSFAMEAVGLDVDIDSNFDPINVKLRVENVYNTIINPVKVKIDSLEVKEGINYYTDLDSNFQHPNAFLAVEKALRDKGIDTSKQENFNFGDNGNWIQVIDAETPPGDGFFMFTVNGKLADKGAGEYRIKDGDEIVIFAEENYQNFEAYSYFDKEVYEVPAGKELEVTLVGQEFDFNGKDIPSKAIEDAIILKDTKAFDEAYTTDKNGKALLTFSEAGEYHISAMKKDDSEINVISRPYAIVNVSEKTEDENSPKEQLNENLDSIYKNLDNPTFGSEWSILSLARGEYGVSKGYYDLYYDNLVKKVKELMSENNGKLHENNGTEHSRLIIGLTSIGKDPSNVGGHNIIEALADYNYITKQGVNGIIYALIALDSDNYEIPTIKDINNQTTKSKLIQEILDKEMPGGGWSWGFSPDADIDMTAMAIQALSPYYNKQNDVKTAVDKAIDWLSKQQKNHGGFEGWGSITPEGASQVIVALTGLNIDPHTDKRFTKNGNSVIDSLMTTSFDKANSMTINQGTYALVAYDRFINKNNSLYNMTDVNISEDPTKPDEKPEKPEEDKEDKDLYISLSIDKKTISKGYVLRPTNVEIRKDESVWDVTEREMKSRKIDYKASGNSYMESIDGDGEFDYGSGSGWMYSVDGKYYQYGSSDFKLKGGEKVEWRYTRDLGEDLGEDLSDWRDNYRPSRPGDRYYYKEEIISQDKTDLIEKEEEKEIKEVLKKKYKDANFISSWALNDIQRATDLGFIEGYNGEFNPKADVTRAEFTKMIISLLNLDIEKIEDNNFTDVNQSDWFYAYVNAAYEAKIIMGSEGKFNPNDSITREEMASIIVRVLKLNHEKTDSEIKDIDKVSTWAKNDVETVVSSGLLVGYENNFNPKDKGTREMATAVLMRAYDYENK